MSKSTTTIALPKIKFNLEARNRKSDLARKREWFIIEESFVSVEKAKEYVTRYGKTDGYEYRVKPVFNDSYTSFGI